MQNSVNFQDKSTNTTPFPRCSVALFHMEAFKEMLGDSSCHIWGYQYPKPVSQQFRNTNVHNVSIILHILTNLVYLNVYGVNLSLGNIWEYFWFVSYPYSRNTAPPPRTWTYPRITIWYSLSMFHNHPTNLMSLSLFCFWHRTFQLIQYKGLKWLDVAFCGIAPQK